MSVGSKVPTLTFFLPLNRSGGGAGQEVAAQFLLFAASGGAGHDPTGPPGGGLHCLPAPATVVMYV